jgi:hypothetical protein
MQNPGVGKKIIEGGFKKAFHSVEKSCRISVRTEICSICFWGIETFKLKLSGRRPFRIYEVDKITEFFAAKGLDAWTGEPINTK